MEVAHKKAEDGNVSRVLSIKVETHLSIKLSKTSEGHLRLKSVRRILAIGLIYGPRTNKQFDIPFLAFWTLPGPLVRHSYSLIFKPRYCVNNFRV